MLANGPLASGPIAASVGATRTLVVAAGSFTLAGYTDAAQDTHALVMAPGAFVLGGGTLVYGEAYTLALIAGAITLKLYPPSSPLRRSLSAKPTTYALTGRADITRANRILAGNAAMYTLTGTQATTGMGLAPMTVGKGVFALTAALSARAGRVVRLAPGAVRLIGQPGSLMAYAGLPVARGRFLFAFPDVGLARGRVLVAALGTFVTTGRAAMLADVAGGRIAAASIVLTGRPATLMPGRRATAARASFILVGGRLTFVQGVAPLIAGAGQIAEAGASALLVRHRVLVSGPGVFEVIARDTSFGYDTDEVVSEPVVSMVCRIKVVGQASWRTRSNPVNGLVMEPGAFQVSPSLAGLGRLMPLTAGSFSFVGSAP